MLVETRHRAAVCANALNFLWVITTTRQVKNKHKAQAVVLMLFPNWSYLWMVPYFLLTYCGCSFQIWNLEVLMLVPCSSPHLSHPWSPRGFYATFLTYSKKSPAATVETPQFPFNCNCFGENITFVRSCCQKKRLTSSADVSVYGHVFDGQSLALCHVSIMLSNTCHGSNHRPYN